MFERNRTGNKGGYKRGCFLTFPSSHKKAYTRKTLMVFFVYCMGRVNRKSQNTCCSMLLATEEQELTGNLLRQPCWVLGPFLANYDNQTQSSWLLLLSVLGGTRTSVAPSGWGTPHGIAGTRSRNTCFTNLSFGLFVATSHCFAWRRSKTLEIGRANSAFSSHFKRESFMLWDLPGGKGTEWILLSARSLFLLSDFFSQPSFLSPFDLLFAFASAVFLWFSSLLPVFFLTLPRGNKHSERWTPAHRGHLWNTIHPMVSHPKGAFLFYALAFLPRMYQGLEGFFFFQCIIMKWSQRKRR